ncbi:hypothetical protein ACFY0G_45105 [Streptomyces sp. NPDC001552]|uniref:hypothetical protein n=1 Tax=Streptomyces sp. NPDC001552 TaxID=3364587 RepID=UPI00369DEDBF
MPVKALAAAGICLATLGAAAAWLTSGHEPSPPCNGLAQDTRVRTSMGAAIQPGMSCAALGEAIVKATAGSEPGRHARAQAQAMKDVLFALAWVQPKNFDVDPARRGPLATALADYGPDLHEMLAGLDSDHVLKAGRDTPPWEAGGTYRLSVYHTVFRATLRAVAEDPRAYALLRLAETRTAAERLAAVPAGATGSELSLRPTRNARALGILDGIADAANGQGAAEARKWHATVLDHLLDDQADQAGQADQTGQADQAGQAVSAGHLTATWLQELKDTPETARAERLRTQGVDMARTWAQARGMDEQTRKDLLPEVGNSARYAYREPRP